MTHQYVERLTIPLIQENHDGKSEKDFVKLKLRRDPTLPTSDLYEFKMSLFENSESEEFLLFVKSFNMTLTQSGALQADAKYQYLRTLVREEVLRQFDLLSADVEGTETLNIDYIIMGLALYFPPVNYLSKETRSVPWN